MGAPAQDRPSIAFGLTIAAGILVIIGGLIVAAIGAIITFFVFGLGAVFGLIGVFWGVLLLVCANMLRSRPERHVGVGVAIIVLSILSFFGAGGGLVIGFILGLVGGIMAIVWSPRPSMGATMPTQPSTVQVTSPAAGSTFCPSCGSPVDPGAQFCRSCGKPL